MFVNSKVRAKITDADPVFKTRYLGNVEVFVPNGKGCTNAPVQKLWDNSGEEKNMKKISTVINIHGIILKDMDNKKDEGQIFPIENISFCNAESIANGKIFSWISKEETSPRLICHAVLCSNPEKAKSMALVMSRAFQIAYKEWKIEQNNVERNERKDSVKNKTADMKLKPKYNVQYPDISGLQTGLPATQGDNSKIKQNGNEEDSKSVASSFSNSSKDSNGSKCKETHLHSTGEHISKFQEDECTETKHGLDNHSLSNKTDASIQAENVESEQTLESEQEVDSVLDKQTAIETTISEKL